MNSKDFKPGDILKATQRELKKGYHPIVYLSGHSNTDFVGAMLTHHNDKKRNVRLTTTSFINQSGYDNTYLVIGKFMKSEGWGPFSKINELTADELQFVNNAIQDQPLETFANYFRRNVKDI